MRGYTIMAVGAMLWATAACGAAVLSQDRVLKTAFSVHAPAQCDWCISFHPYQETRK